jgi:branched-chain amino acid transport system permease protein
MSSYAITILTLIVIQAIVVCGLNVIVGYAGQISLGHAAFFGIGTYSAALLSTRGGLSFWTALPLVLLICAVTGLLLGLPSLRLKHDFLAITTIGINFIVQAIFLYVPFFGGAMGISGIPRIQVFGQALRGAHFLYLCLFCLGVVMAICWFFTRVFAGLACFALREEEAAATSLGISPVRFKLLAFMLGTVFAGLGGSLYAHYMRFVSADDFSFPLSVSFLAMLVLGGMGSLLGPFVGALILGALPEVFRPLAEFRILFYALMLLLMIRFQPGGILGESSLVRKRLFPLFLRRQP